MIRYKILAAFVAFVCIDIAAAQEPIQFGRTPDISPDGKLVAFSYLGDIWVVETIGGVARPITMHEAHDVGPIFSPDGRWIAFSSNRHGQYDVFVSPSYGGKPRRLTFDSAQDIGGRLDARWQGRGLLILAQHVVSLEPRAICRPVRRRAREETSLPGCQGRELFPSWQRGGVCAWAWHLVSEKLPRFIQ